MAIERKKINGVIHRECPRCNEVKPPSAFIKDKSLKKDGHETVCRRCRSILIRARKVGSTFEEIENLMSLCGTAFHNVRLAIDHTEANGKKQVRGALCQPCNSFLLPWLERQLNKNNTDEIVRLVQMACKYVNK